jgi:hypothetical protein
VNQYLTGQVLTGNVLLMTRAEETEFEQRQRLGDPLGLAAEVEKRLTFSRLLDAYAIALRSHDAYICGEANRVRAEIMERVDMLSHHPYVPPIARDVLDGRA